MLQIQSQSLISLPNMLAKSCTVYTFAFITPYHFPLIFKKYIEPIKLFLIIEIDNIDAPGIEPTIVKLQRQPPA